MRRGGSRPAESGRNVRSIFEVLVTVARVLVVVAPCQRLS